MKKALYVATVDIHIEKFHLPYLKLLHENGYEVHVATNGDESFPYCDEKHKICIERSPFKFNNLKAIKQLRTIVEKEKFDIIHCHTPMGAVVTRLAVRKSRKKYKTKIIYTAHGFHFYKGAPIVNWLLFYPVEKVLSRYTDTLITINKEDYDFALRKFKKYCKDIQYIPGVGIETKKFEIENTSIDRNQLLKQIGLDKKDYILTCVARLDKNKNQSFLIDVMEKLKNNFKNIKLLLVGPDEYDGFYQKLVTKKKLENVLFLGRRDDIPKILSISNIVVSASMREGLPVNVMESFASGIPVVALDCRGMKDLVENGKNGFVIDSDNVDDFAKSIIDIYNMDAKVINRIRTNNKEKAKKYDVEEIRKKLSNIYFK